MKLHVSKHKIEFKTNIIFWNAYEFIHSEEKQKEIIALLPKKISSIESSLPTNITNEIQKKLNIQIKTKKNWSNKGIKILICIFLISNITTIIKKISTETKVKKEKKIILQKEKLEKRTLAIQEKKHKSSNKKLASLLYAIAKAPMTMKIIECTPGNISVTTEPGIKKKTIDYLFTLSPEISNIKTKKKTNSPFLILSIDYDS